MSQRIELLVYTIFNVHQRALNCVFWIVTQNRDSSGTTIWLCFMHYMCRSSAHMSFPISTQRTIIAADIFAESATIVGNSYNFFLCILFKYTFCVAFFPSMAGWRVCTIADDVDCVNDDSIISISRAYTHAPFTMNHSILLLFVFGQLRMFYSFEIFMSAIKRFEVG